MTKLDWPAGSHRWDAALMDAWATGWRDYFAPAAPSSVLTLLAEVRSPVSGFEAWCKAADVVLLWIVRSPGLNTARLRLPPGQLDAVSLAPGVEHLQLGQALRPGRPLDVARDPRALGMSRRAPVPMSDSEVLIAVIDHGCPFAHPAYRAPDGGTRVHALWDQDPLPEFPATAGSLPSSLGSGRQISRSQFNAWIAAAGEANWDEHALYEHIGYRALRARWTHGAAAMGVADNGSADLVFVQLPRSSVIAPSAGAVDVNILEALCYIDQCRGPRTRRVHVLVDYGSFLGPHDGTSLFERTLDAFLEDPSRNDAHRVFEVVFASGNGHDKAIHASLPIGATMGQDHWLDWMVPPGSEVATQAEVWIDAQALPLSLHLQSADGTSHRVTLNARGLTPTRIALGSGLSAVIKPHASAEGREQIQVLLSADAQAQVTRRIHLGVLLTRALRQPLHAYSVWGGRNPGVQRAIQAPRFAMPTQAPTAWTLNGPGSLLGSACGYSPHVLLVGGFEAWAPHRRVPYACGGAARAGRRSAQGAVPSGNDCIAACEERPSLSGLRLMGVSAASTVRVNGTSFAAPQVVRARANGQVLDRKPPDPLPAAPVGLAREEFNEPRWPRELIGGT